MTLYTDLRFILLTALAAALVLASCGEMDPEADPRMQLGSEPIGKILFVKDGDVYLWAGSDPQRLTDYGNALSPAWAPDGERFLFVRTGDAFTDLVLGNANTGMFERLTSNEPPFTPGTEEYLSRVVWIFDPTWSRSGSGIAYVSDRNSDENYVWYQARPDSDANRVHCSALRSGNAENPDFSPNGARVVFAQRESGPADLNRWMELRICDLNSGEMIELVEGEPGQSAYFPRWSPNGEWIVYVQRDEAGRNDLWAIEADGGQSVRLTELGDVTAPAWSPDGKHIAFFDRDGSGFAAVFIEFEVGSDGVPVVSEPETLFSEDGIHAPSGMSWGN